MAGLVGAFRWSGGEVDRGLLVRQSELLSDRGPDDGAVYLDGPFGLAHRRLDAEGTDHQPHWDEESRLAILVDGDLIGTEALGRELVRRGHRVQPERVPDVLLAAFREWGDRFLERLQGSFALVIHDRSARTLLLARDRMGGRPLFYHPDRRRFAFASELHALAACPVTPRTLDPASVAAWFQHGWVPAPRTLLAGVRAVEPGEALLVSEREVQSRRFATLGGLGVAPESAWAELRDALADAVRERSAGVETVALSGGRSSAAVLALAHAEGRELEAVSFVGPDPDDRRAARRFTSELDLAHRELKSGTGPANVLKSALDAMDQPVAEPWFVTAVELGRGLRAFHRLGTPVLTGFGAAELTLERSPVDHRAVLVPALRHREAEAARRPEVAFRTAAMLDRVGAVAERSLRSPFLTPAILGRLEAASVPSVGLERWLRGTAPAAICAAGGRQHGPDLAAWFRGPAQRLLEETLFGSSDPGVIDRARLRRWWYAHQLRVADHASALWSAAVFTAWYAQIQDPRPRRRRR